MHVLATVLAGFESGVRALASGVAAAGRVTFESFVFLLSKMGSNPIHLAGRRMLWNGGNCVSDACLERGQ